MSDADERQELVGLARSVDALFKGASTAEARVAAQNEPALIEAQNEPALVEAAVEARDEPAPLEAHGEATVEAQDEPASFEARDEPRPVDAPDEPPTVQVHDDSPTVEAQRTPLDLAVDAFLGGDGGRASEIEALGAQMLEKKNLEPVGRSLTKLALASGEPPDSSTFAVARSIMAPVVLGWLARRMGAERDEARRAEYRQVCRVLGEDMARAIRDDLAESTDRLARRVHCETLIDMGEPGRLVVEEMVHDENRFLVRNAVAILADLGGEGAVELVTSALANPDARVRREALRSLAKLGDPEAGALVVGLLEDPDAEVRMAAAVAAGELRVERALRPLIGMLDASKDPDRCVPLIRALGQLGDPGAVTSIEKHAVRSLFSKPRTDVRIAAYRALHHIGTPHARRLLNQAVDDKEPGVKAAVKEMLHMR